MHLVTMTTFLSCVLVLAASCGTLHSLPVGDQGNDWERSGKFEGDIVFQDSMDARNGILNPVYYWPNRTLFYKMSYLGAAQTGAVWGAMDEIEANTCIRMVPATAATRDFVNIEMTWASGGCYSAVGKKGFSQPMQLARSDPGVGCFQHGAILHELLHTLGFYHQHSATDRDDYVDIIWDNIISGRDIYFTKYPATEITDFGVSYDYGSVMHYDERAFSKNGEKTIVPKDPSAVIGQRDGLSKKDIEKLNRMYGCEK